MQSLYDRIKASLATDDLFFRVSCLCYAAVAGAIGGFIVWLLVASSARQDMALPLYVLFWAIAVAFLIWAALLLLGCVSPPDTRPARWGAAALPKIVSFDGEVGILSYLTFLPAAALTLLLRGIGIRGCQSRRSSKLVNDAERNTRSQVPRVDV